MRVLVAVDGSDAAKNALEHAIDVADAMDATITVVHAVDPNVYEYGGTDPVVSLADADRRLVVEKIEDAEERAMTLLEEFDASADELGTSVETELLYGDPVEAITDYADEFDALFVGHRGRSERTEQLLGSVAKAIVERVTIPVTVVR